MAQQDENQRAEQRERGERARDHGDRQPQARAAGELAVLPGAVPPEESPAGLRRDAGRGGGGDRGRGGGAGSSPGFGRWAVAGGGWRRITSRRSGK